MLLYAQCVGCLLPHTVTHDKEFPSLGQCFTLREDVFFEGAGAGLLWPIGAPGVPKSVEAWQREPGRWKQHNPSIAGVVRVGVRIRLETLTDTFNGPRVTGRILDGEYRGRAVEVIYLLENGVRPGVEWDVDPKYLAPCPENTTSPQ